MMQIEEKTVSPWIVLGVLALIILAVLGIALVGAANAFGPGEQAKANVIEQIGAQATAQALQLQHDRALAENRIQINEQQQMSDTRIRLATYGGLAALAALIVGLLAGVWHAWRLARLPAVRRVGPNLHVAETPAGPMLIDSLTGQRALLRNPAEVSQLRAAAMVASMMASTAAQISRTTRSAAPADWLPQLARIGPPVYAHQPGEGHSELGSTLTSVDQDGLSLPRSGNSNKEQ